MFVNERQPFSLQKNGVAVLSQPQADEVRIQIYGGGDSYSDFYGAELALEGTDLRYNDVHPDTPSEQLFASPAAMDADTTHGVWKPMEDGEGEIVLSAARDEIQIDKVPDRIRLRETGQMDEGQTLHGVFIYRRQQA